jgi:cysteinyl-tRNA synthetase
MALKHLGAGFDIHGGGLDLIFPHHENEIAQSEAATGEKFVRAWMHNGFVTVNKEKMSKSLGNFFTLSEVFAQYQPAVVRYMLLSVHYRSPLDFSREILEQSRSTLNGMKDAVGRATRLLQKQAGMDGSAAAHDAFAPVIAALQDDLNTPAALGALFSIVNRKEGQPDAASFDRAMFALGFDLAAAAPKKPDAPAEVTALAEKRWAAKQAKDFATADALRKDLAAAGWSMLDRKDGYSLEPAKKP